jgi:histidinol-phosphate aminotransferase
MKVHLKNWFRPAILKMKGYTPGEQPTDLRTIKLNTNENPYAPAQSVQKAVKKLGDFRLRLYPEPTAHTLRLALSKHYGWPVEGILVGNGSDEILSMLFRACVGKGDLVQYPDLTYSLYPVLAEMSEAKIKEIPLGPSFELPFNKLSLRARLTLWGQPNPPVGNCFDSKEMSGFCEKTKGLVVIDEAYVDFADHHCLDWARKCPNVLVLRTMSKSFSLAGARLGYVFGHPDVIDQLLKVKDSYNVNRITQGLALEALSPNGLREQKIKIKLIQAERERLAESLMNMGFAIPPSQANFLLAFCPADTNAEMLYKNLKRKLILIRYFPHPRLRRCLRITVGTPEQNNKLLTSLKAVMSSK